MPRQDSISGSPASAAKAASVHQRMNKSLALVMIVALGMLRADPESC